MVHEQPGVPHAFGTQTATRQTVVSWVTGTVRKLRGGGGGGKAPGAARARRSPKRKGAAGVARDAGCSWWWDELAAGAPYILT